MSKSKGKKKPRNNPLKQVGLDASAARVSEVVQRMLRPPESVIAHLTRVDAPFWVAPYAVDADGGSYARPCLVVPYDDLVAAELKHITAGGETSDVYTPEVRKEGTAAAKEAIQKAANEHVSSNGSSMGVYQQVPGSFNPQAMSKDDITSLKKVISEAKANLVKQTQAAEERKRAFEERAKKADLDDDEITLRTIRG
ncbi:hypothetical protein GJ25_gp076 [Mycobacterium phage Hawkeye]|uniref:Uncharacterized protein n=1 Tax=Mycobacterium phage Hawkeye TaxID=1458711 RepID=X2KN99_9CAUD|nr:hypothetical protein GJ25_gp076 [Mycobacterium phage Hawkeye]AHN84087.1 hypothetical protein PBI_HAWKEYE_76 [Mycobacterium phage Hawkeye]